MPESLPLATNGPNSLASWRARLQPAKEARDALVPRWKEFVQRYLGKSLDRVPVDDMIVVPTDFAAVEQKKGQMYFQSPEVQLQPLMPGLEDAVSVFQAVVNRKIGPDDLNLKATMRECLSDLLIAAGVCAVKIGYEAVTDGMTETQVGTQPVLDGMGQPAVDPATQQPLTMPVMAPAPNIIHERYFIDRISPIKLLIPADFRGSDYDKAAWLGFEFEMDRAVAERAFGLGESEGGSSVADAQTLSRDKVPDSQTPKVKGQEVWYRPAVFDPAVIHPEVFRRLVLIDGLDRAAVHEDSKYHVLGPDGKSLTGMVGNPVHLTGLRYVPDSCWPPSDVAMSKPLTDEKNLTRSLMLQERRRRLPKSFADTARIGEEGMQKLMSAQVQEFIGVSALGNANEPLTRPVDLPVLSPETFQIDTIINRDIDEVWGFATNQRPTTRSATEINDDRVKTDIRMDVDETVFLEFAVEAVAKMAALLQLFADTPDYVEIVGRDGEKRLEAWDKTAIQGRYAFTAKPDSSKRLDAAQEFQQDIQRYNFWARDPNFNRAGFLKKLVQKAGYDPKELVVEQLPEPKPEPPKIALSFKGEDLAPQNPAFAVVREVLAQLGVTITDQAVATSLQMSAMQAQLLSVLQPGGMPAGQPTGAHPGMAEPADVLNRHQTDLTGGMQGQAMGPDVVQ